jgi:6,7-dimethyl-8-ribityllumazine synthase
MVSQENRARVDMELHVGGSQRVLIIESPYYQEITGELVGGACAVLDAAGVGYDRVAVPGALEIPQALRQAVAAGFFTSGSKAGYAGAIILGCVVRGETSHYDIVCNNTNHWVMETAIQHNIPLGNGVLTVDTEAQALARARGGADGKGGDAARACLRLIHLAQTFGQRVS